MLSLENNQLEGTITKLKRKFAVLEKVKVASGTDQVTVAAIENSSRQTEFEYRVIAVVSRKLLFKSRPRPIKRKRIYADNPALSC